VSIDGKQYNVYSVTWDPGVGTASRLELRLVKPLAHPARGVYRVYVWLEHWERATWMIEKILAKIAVGEQVPGVEEPYGFYGRRDLGYG